MTGGGTTVEPIPGAATTPSPKPPTQYYLLTTYPTYNFVTIDTPEGFLYCE